MARLVPTIHAAARAPHKRYTFDVAKLERELGGREKAAELARQFGLPPLGAGRTPAAATAYLIELAYRMERPIENIHDYVIQER